MAVYKPPKLKNASEFLTNKKVNRSSPEEYYEVTSQKFGLYDMDTAYSGSQRAKQEKEAEKRSLLPKINIQELRDNSGIEYREFLPREEVSKQNIIAHQGEQPKAPLVQRLLKDNATDETRATLGVQKKPSAPRINSQVATLSGKQPEQYSQQISAEGGRYLSDGDIKGQVADKAENKTDIGAVGRSLRDLPRNLASGLVNTYDNLRKSGILGSPQQREVLSEEDFNKSPLSKAHGSYENYLKAMNQYNKFVGEDKLGQQVERLQQTLPSEVNDDTTLWEKMVRSAAGSWLPSMASAGMGGALAGVAGQFVSNPITLEVVRTMPLFASGMDSGLQSAEGLGFEGAKKYSYAVISGLLEAGTERLSSLGLEGKLLGMKTSGGVGGTREFLRAIFEEAGSEALNEVGQQLLTGQYTNYEDFEMDMESVLIAAGSAALMGGFGATGELINGIKYRTVGTVDNKVIIETEDGRRESVSPEVVMKHQLNTNKEARKTQEILKADAEIQELAKTFTAKEETLPTMPLENATTPQERFEVETEPNTQIREKAVTEPLSEQKQEVGIKEETKVIPPPQTRLEGLEERLDNMINKNLIDTKKKLDMAKRMNEQIVELGGKDRIEDIEPKKVEESTSRKRASTIEQLNVSDIGVDPKRFQFKEATDTTSGAGTSLKGTDTFNPNLAGVVTVWRDNAGKDWIVNGHHRLELARRSGTKNIDARILYESDGITESLARQIGAEQNIAEGKGSAKDAAQIFRESGYSLEDLSSLGLSIKDKFIEQAYNISKLNDRLWERVVNKQLKENQASMIGEAFPNDFDKQNAVMDYILEEGAVTERELKEVIDGVRFSDTNYEEQYTLMGLETVAKNNFKEKVKLTTKIKQLIGGEKSAFSKLVKAQSAKKIENAGNILNQKANESRLEMLNRINDIIDFGKNRQGDPINIIINKYASEVQNGAKMNYAAEKAIEEITSVVQDGGYLELAINGINSQSNEQITIGDVANETQQNELRDVEGINQDSERAEIEGQGSFFDTETESATAEDTEIMTSDDIESNDMAIKAETLPMEQETAEEIDFIPEFDLIDGYRESKTKQSMQESKFSDRAKRVSEDVDYWYETVTFKGEELRSRQQVTGRVEAELARLESMDTENSKFTASDVSDTIMILELTDKLMNETGDAYWEKVLQRAELMRKKILSNFGQGLVMGKMTKPLSPKGQLVAINTEVTDKMTDTQKQGKQKVDKEMTDILSDVPTENGKVKIDSSEVNSFIETIMERFPNLKKRWGREWTKILQEGTATKAEILDSIYKATGVPNIDIQTKAEILEHLEKMSELEVNSPEYNKHNNEVKSLILHSRGISIWTKISAIQTYAMLGNVKTGLKNELGNFIGFGMGQLDSKFAEKLDRKYAKTTGARTVADQGSTTEYFKGYKEGFKQSFQDFKDRTDSRVSSSKYFDDSTGKVFRHNKDGYAKIIVDLVTGENKLEAAKEFATHSAAKAENLTKFIVDDRRHGFARYEMSRAAIENTANTIAEYNKTVSKDQQIVFSKEEALANLDYEVAYYAFNNNTVGAKILTEAVKALNRVSTLGKTSEFGAGTIVAKFTKTPMNIIAFTGDHLGYAYGVAKAKQISDYKELRKTMSKADAKVEALKLNQRELAMGTSKAITGATLIGVGMLFGALGAITPDKDREDESDLLEAQGYKSGYFNISGLVRNLLGGSTDREVYDYGSGTVHEGDTIVSINQLAPGGAFMLLGSRIMDYLTAEEADRSISNILKATVNATVKGTIDSATDLVDLPFNRTASMLINEFKYANNKENGVYEAMANVSNKLLGSVVTSFIPSPVKQTSMLLDPYAKKYSRDSAEAVSEQVKANIPTLRDDVPYAFYVNGEPIQYSGEKNAVEALWNAYVAPYYKSTVKYDKSLKDITSKVADGKVSAPKFAPNKIDDIELTNTEKQKYQKVYWREYQKSKDHKEASKKAKADFLKDKKKK